MVSDAELDDCRRVAEEAARLGGRELLRRFGDHGRVDYKTAHTDPVSDADRASEALVVELLRARRPDDGILAEEGSGHVGRSGLRWVLDPLDGTVNYVSGMPFWCVSVACEEETADGWQPLVGVVLDPVHDELFHAALGRGAYLGDTRLARPAGTALDEVILATGYAYDVAHRRVQAAVVTDLAGDVRGVRMLGSTALALCWVAAGRCDAYVEDRAFRWDWAAGLVIATEAGAAVEVAGSRVLAAPPELIDEFRPRVAALG
ncbi:inositol monophosphatase family protein [Micromonospora rubida]|uniref:inositol monophosphatase family protein n=1 Tax=Micromonospora rubida TaxID=2697657 RepID=UPI001376FED8|nr:inositol monophosphatase family protein [Micromonospora rubida]NBE79556.1 inositol monophosphatase [Micromonospora rubida]